MSHVHLCVWQFQLLQVLLKIRRPLLKTNSVKRCVLHCPIRVVYSWTKGTYTTYLHESVDVRHGLAVVDGSGRLGLLQLIDVTNPVLNFAVVAVRSFQFLHHLRNKMNQSHLPT